MGGTRGPEGTSWNQRDHSVDVLAKAAGMRLERTPKSLPDSSNGICSRPLVIEHNLITALRYLLNSAPADYPCAFLSTMRGHSVSGVPSHALLSPWPFLPLLNDKQPFPKKSASTPLLCSWVPASSRKIHPIATPCGNCQPQGSAGAAGKPLCPSRLQLPLQTTDWEAS